ncbi:30S ribosomal protein S8 [Candidatus Microgenomates bacterium]|nr:30S ribosomal protein S8 [Candidatus Microgenomates bacterium]
MTSDPIADFLIQIKNGYMAKKSQVTIPHSKMKESLAKILNKNGWLGKVTVAKSKENFSQIIIDLLYDRKLPKVTEIVIVSKPGRRVYVKADGLPRVLGGLGMAVISTSSGLMTDKEARKKGLGGEVICKIW